MLFNETKLVATGVGMTWRESHPSASALFRLTRMESKAPNHQNYHTPVLLSEVMHYICPGEGKVLVDGTLGGGGHTESMLRRGATVLGCDQDEQAHAFAENRLAEYGDRFIPLWGNFAQLPELLGETNFQKVDGILADIGVSSWQLDEAARGFSFGKDGPLDMRMNPAQGQTAADVVNGYAEVELLQIFREYGEEKAARKIARRIVERRESKEFETTLDLANFISSFIPRGGKSHPATRVFQALRIEVNDELGVLKELLSNAASLLKPGGRLAIITFHSLEDRIVKQFFKHASQSEIDRKEWPAPRPNPDYQYKLLTRRPVVAASEELSQNPRARSAKLRVVEKI